MEKLMHFKILKSILSILIYLFITPVMALTISTAPTVGVMITKDNENNITYMTGNDVNANINVTTIQDSLATSHVSLNDSYNSDTLLTNGVNIIWSSAYNLIVNARQNIIIGNAAKFTSNGYGNLILRADYTADNDGTVIQNGSGPVIFLTGDAVAKIYYHPNDYTVPTNFDSMLNRSSGTLYAYMAINNLADLQQINRNLRGNYALAADIDVRGALFAPIGSPSNPYTGSFDGQGYTIRNLNISYPNLIAVGFFGAATSSSIANLKLMNEIVNGREMVGGLAGTMRGSLSRVAVTGNISGEARVGGLIGSSDWIRMMESYTEGLVRLRENAGGGLIGTSVSELLINNSYSSAIITSQSTGNPNEGIVGGLVGDTIRSGRAGYGYCYATGLNNATRSAGGLLGNYSDQPVFIANFWNLETTKQNYSTGNHTALIGAKGLTTIEMQQSKTYKDLYWDFHFVWGLDEAESYPYLLWSRKKAPWTTVVSGPNKVLTTVG